MEYDGLIDIAIGKSRMDKKWQNKEMLWSSFVDRVSVTHRTHETYKEYINAKPARQDAIKDIGGFVGGHIAGGRRKNGSIMHRTLLTLDVDNADADFWESFQMVCSHAACLYTTHKHAPDNYRLRLLLPVDRPVTVEEYEAIARKVASWVGIENFDPTTFQATRLMYWPSTSKDGEFLFDKVDAPWISADEVLASYDDWRNTAEWPYHYALDEMVHSDIKQQGDPLLKTGIIGAFCRSHTIQEAIRKYLPLVYEATEDENRFTYILGTTANGLVIYEDKFAYSHHSSDPISSKLCNAWDMVRLHKFGSMDDRAKEDTRPQDLPSFKAMADLAAEDKDVRRQIGIETREAAKEIFQDEGKLMEGEPTGDPDSWMEDMLVDKSGNYVTTTNNIVLILENDNELKGCFGYNEFTNREVMLRDLPWRKKNIKKPNLVDSDDAALRHYLETVYGLVGIQKISDALNVVIKRNSFHPVREYLEEIVWDGNKRLDGLLVDFLGAEDNEYTRMVCRKTFIAAVARVMDPGCKFDNCLVLVGGQGIGKSTFVRLMGRKWYSDSFNGVLGKDAFEQLQGIWIMEMGELAGLKKADVENVKHFISKQEDEFRVAYGKRKENFPRQNIFIATTNETNFLKDYTGNRRFWPVQCTVTEVKGLTNEIVNQVWAEAYVGYMQGEQLHLSRKLEAVAKEVQSEHMEIDTRIGIVQAYLDKPIPATWYNKNIYERRAWMQGEDIVEAGTEERQQVSIAEIYCELFGGVMKDFSPYVSRDYHNLMSRIPGWVRSSKMKRLGVYGKQFIYEKVST